MKTREMITGDAKPVIEEIEEIKDDDAAKPAEEAEREQVDREKEEFNKGTDNPVKNDKDKGSDEVGLPGGVETKAGNQQASYIEGNGSTENSDNKCTHILSLPQSAKVEQKFLPEGKTDIPPGGCLLSVGG